MDASKMENHTKLEYIFHTPDTWCTCPTLKVFYILNKNGKQTNFLPPTDKTER